MRIKAEELAQLLNAVSTEAKELPALRERVLKLEHKLNEIYDMLTDFRVNQVMGVSEMRCKLNLQCGELIFDSAHLGVTNGIENCNNNI